MKLKSLLLYLCFYLYYIFGINFAHATENTWDVLRQQFKIDHAVNQPEVRQQIHWLTTHPHYLQKLAQAEPYIYLIITEIKKRNLPGEVALIPMLESAYDPFAYSGAGAAGLWQLMPGTGSDLGLKRDWWFDGRRSISQSTKAALNYLAYLRNYFHGNWLLAIAAYDSGEGTMTRIIRKSGRRHGQINFWSLAVPTETKAYVPRLLALAEVIKNPAQYHIRLPNIPHSPYFEEVNIGSQIDLNHAAKLAGISYRELIKLNPGYNHWTTAPNQPYKLLIPMSSVACFTKNLAELPKEKRASLRKHRVGAKDTLAGIANRYHTTVKLLMELNQLKSNRIRMGSSLTIPAPMEIAKIDKPVPKKVAHFQQPQQLKIVHIVQKNDSLNRIHLQYHVPVKSIIAWNHLRRTRLQIGQALILWQSNRLATTSPIAHKKYMIRRGDSLYTIAKHHHISLKSLVKLNANLNMKALRPGQSINLG